ncbi:hypothetical protein ACN4EG_12640 [Alkalinema pantanalense CENA528]|uniref:hypothetical protein n=1 Tax=Alkalinema pantanalense TaxID=1620705 RepID=UPI003D6FD307
MNTLRLLPLLDLQDLRVFLVLAVMQVVAGHLMISWHRAIAWQTVFPGIVPHKLVDPRNIVCKSSLYRIFSSFLLLLHLKPASLQPSTFPHHHRSRSHAATLMAC